MTSGSHTGQADGRPDFNGLSSRIDDEKFRLDRLQRVRQMKNSVDDIDSQVFRLLTERDELIRHIEGGLCDISTDQYFFGSDIDEIMYEWYESRFHSKVVRDAVSMVRKTFMDDSKEASRSFVCTDITFGSTMNMVTVYTKYVTFEFMRNDDVFRICIPVLQRKTSLSGTSANDSMSVLNVDQDPLSESCGLGDICITVHGEILASSLVLDVVRRTIAELMDNYSETVSRLMKSTHSAAQWQPYHRKGWCSESLDSNGYRVLYTPW